MKKLMAIFFLAACVTAQAQLQPVLKNRRGIAILPQKGDFCIGISANPFLDYFGNMFNNNQANKVPSFISGSQMVYGKYMKTAQFAYRGSLLININNQSYLTVVRDLAPGASPDAVVADKYKISSSQIGISAGFEKRRGDTRLQGYYGADLFVNFGSGMVSKAEFGNRIEYYDTGAIRTIRSKRASDFTIGVLGFAGVEYFVAPRISIGGELMIGPSINYRGPLSTTNEYYDFNTNQAVEMENKLDVKSTDFRFGNSVFGNGALKVLFYF